jgi:pimeloyl-ACP methyl ester carboxylesterase
VPFFHNGDVAIHFHEQGDRGVPIVCIHPPCLSSRLFTYLRTELVDKHRIITYDIRGHGYSESGAAQLTLPLVAEDLRRLLDACGVKKAYLCSYGAGSFPLLTALLAYPDRFCGGIIISGTAAYTDIISRSKLQTAYISSALRARDIIAFSSALREADNRTAFQALNSDAKQGDSAKWRDYVAACLNATFEPQLPRIHLPMLLVYGTADRFDCANAERMHRLLPDSELYGVLKAKHQLLMKQPVKTGLVIGQWIAKHEQPSIADTLEERSELLQELVEHGIEDRNEVEAGSRV